MSLSSPNATSKRKRCETLDTDTPIAFSFDFSPPDTSEDGERSPRSKMAHRFLGLALGSGGGAATLNDDGDDDDNHGTTDAARKRQKLHQDVTDAAPAGHQDQDEKKHITQISDGRPHVHVGFKTHAAAPADCPSKAPLSPHDTGTSIPKSPRRKRAGTPPLKFNIAPNGSEEVDTGQVPAADEPKEDDYVVDPVRAALTWHEDEITIYDPEDADDDGIGVNGIGFKPTPALAQSRVIRRRQQMAEYRKREEGEARSRRTQRRRGEESLSARPKRKLPARRVHFLDPERQHTAVFTL
ncbi:hypothetical protein E4U55_003531 [Claviceps digitariae]|nr:hypothetical protein E4U55_003531 [Claviceps digitariae]